MLNLDILEARSFGDGGTVVGVVVESFSDNSKTYARATGLHPLVAMLDFPRTGRG